MNCCSLVLLHVICGSTLYQYLHILITSTNPCYCIYSVYVQVSLWEVRLSDLDEYLLSLNAIQRRWVYLEPIFGRGALPREEARFKRVDEDFRYCVCVFVWLYHISRDQESASTLLTPRNSPVWNEAPSIRCEYIYPQIWSLKLAFKPVIDHIHCYTCLLNRWSFSFLLHSTYVLMYYSFFV